jgi:hypothetical protein
MRSKTDEPAAPHDKPERKLRLYTTVKGELAAAYQSLLLSSSLGEPELLRQALIRLINEVNERGELVVANLAETPRSA